MTDNTQEREAFEAWAISQDYGVGRRDFPDSSRFGEYVNIAVELAWLAWNRRASLPAQPAQAVGGGVNAGLLGALKQALAVLEEWQVGLTVRQVAKAAIADADAIAKAAGSAKEGA